MMFKFLEKLRIINIDNVIEIKRPSMATSLVSAHPMTEPPSSKKNKHAASHLYIYRYNDNRKNKKYRNCFVTNFLFFPIFVVDYFSFCSPGEHSIHLVNHSYSQWAVGKARCLFANSWQCAINLKSLKYFITSMLCVGNIVD